jgi:hypothetical protein
MTPIVRTLLVAIVLGPGLAGCAALRPDAGTVARTLAWQRMLIEAQPMVTEASDPRSYGFFSLWPFR